MIVEPSSTVDTVSRDRNGYGYADAGKGRYSRQPPSRGSAMVLACLTCSALAAASLASSARAQAIDSLIDSWKAFEKYSCVGVPFQPFRRAIGCSLSLSAVGLK